MARLPVVLTCPAGFERVVAEIAERELSSFEPFQVDSGYIRGTTTAAVGQLRVFPCATNVFHVVATVPRKTLTTDLQQLSRMLGTTTRPQRLPRQGTFRLRIHDDGRFAPHDSAPARKLEADVSDWSGLRPARGAAGTEFWVIRRRGHVDSLLTTKLTAGNARVPAGVLRPEVCATLARIVPLDGASLVIDPFAGSGAIGIACLEAGAERVWLNDPNPAALHGLRALPRSLRERVGATALDFRDLDVDAASLSAIVTDPPWDHYDELDTSVASLYADLTNFAVQALVTGGALVVLTGGGDEAIQSLTTRKELVLGKTLPVLINGRKAQIVVSTRA
jgi:16S rRNA G966 N2-methylase RsmD